MTRRDLRDLKLDGTQASRARVLTDARLDPWWRARVYPPAYINGMISRAKWRKMHHGYISNPPAHLVKFVMGKYFLSSINQQLELDHYTSISKGTLDPRSVKHDNYRRCTYERY